LVASYTPHITVTVTVRREHVARHRLPAQADVGRVLFRSNWRGHATRAGDSYSGMASFPAVAAGSVAHAVRAHMACDEEASMTITVREIAEPGAAPKDGARPGFLSDIGAIRERARQHVADGAVTQGYGADRQRVLQLLNEALATEIVCALRYRRHYYMANGAMGEAIKGELLKHANEEQQHADAIAERIVQLGGEPDMNPMNICDRSHSEYVEGSDLADMVKEDLIAERIAVESYTEMIRYIGDGDPTTRRLLEGILAVEEEHAEELASMLGTLSGNRA
jgi:bacterioferritin